MIFTLLAHDRDIGYPPCIHPLFGYQFDKGDDYNRIIFASLVLFFNGAYLCSKKKKYFVHFKVNTAEREANTVFLWL